MLLLASILTACGSTTSDLGANTASSSAIACPNSAPLSTDPANPGLKGVRIGSVLLLGFADDRGKAVLTGFDPRRPAKVSIQPIEPLPAALRLEGWRCSTGERLRVDYGPSDNIYVAALLPAGRDKEGAPVPYSGDMRFTATGKWMVSISTKVGHNIASAVFLVQ